MHEKVSGEDIEAFTSALSDGWSESLIGNWLDTAFGRVATHNDTLSADYEAFIATRDNATFRPLRRDEH